MKEVPRNDFIQKVLENFKTSITSTAKDVKDIDEKFTNRFLKVNDKIEDI